MNKNKTQRWFNRINVTPDRRKCLPDPTALTKYTLIVEHTNNCMRMCLRTLMKLSIPMLTLLLLLSFDTL